MPARFLCAREHRDRRRGGIGHLGAEPTVLDRIVRRVAGGEDPAARASDSAVLVDWQEAMAPPPGRPRIAGPATRGIDTMR